MKRILLFVTFTIFISCSSHHTVLNNNKLWEYSIKELIKLSEVDKSDFEALVSKKGYKFLKMDSNSTTGTAWIYQTTQKVSSEDYNSIGFLETEQPFSSVIYKFMALYEYERLIKQIQNDGFINKPELLDVFSSMNSDISLVYTKDNIFILISDLNKEGNKSYVITVLKTK